MSGYQTLHPSPEITVSAAERSPAPSPIACLSSGWHLTLLALFWALIYGPGMPSPPLLDDADSVHAEVSREMLLRHDYVTLYANGIRYLEKAPLPYWLNAASYALFGVNETATRLPLSLFVLALLFALYQLGREMFSPEAGFYGALVAATAFGPWVFTRFLIPDIIIGFWLTLTVLIFWRMLQKERPSRQLCWALATVTALDILTKGLIGIIFPVAIIGGYLLLTGNLRFLLRMRLPSSALVFSAIAVPWHVLATLRNPPQGEAKGFFWFYFINEQVNRYLDKRIPRDYDKVQIYFFWGLLLAWLLPWSVYLIQSLRVVPITWPRKWKLGSAPTERKHRAALLLAIWAAVILVFFSFSTRQEYYVVPALPALALLIGAWLAEQSQQGITSAGRWGARVLLAVGVLASVAAFALLLYSAAPPPGTDLSVLLRQRPDMYALSFGHFFDLTAQAMGAFRTPLLLAALATLGGAVVQFWFWRIGCIFRAALTTASMMVVFLFAAHMALATFNPVLGSKTLAQAIQRQYRPGDVIVLDGEYTNGSTVGFYTGVQLHLLNGRINDLWYGSLFPDAPQIFEDDASFVRMWQGKGRVWFVTAHPELHSKLLSGGHELVRSGGKVVYSNY